MTMCGEGNMAGDRWLPLRVRGDPQVTTNKGAGPQSYNHKELNSANILRA